MAVSTKKTTIIVDMTKLHLMKAGIGPKAHAILDKAAFDIEAIAKELAAVLTGAMKSSIYVSGSSGGRSNYGERKSDAAARNPDATFFDEVKPSGKFERIIGASVVYAIFPEIHGQPYIVPAVEQVRPGFTKAWKALVV